LLQRYRRGGISDIAGLKAEDVIIEANNETIRNEQDLIFVINDLENGDMLKMKILRGGSEREIEFELKPAK
jgi:S1-C subfamily serine protease